MGVRNELYGQLIEVVNKNHDDEPEIQPSRPIGRNDLLLCSQAEVPERMLRPLEPIWGICYHQQDDAFISARLAREADCDISLLSDFYQRASMMSPTATEQARCGGRRIVELLEQRHADDLRIVESLAGGGAIYVVTPTYERGLEFYRLTNPQALANLLWNNLVRFYTNTGIGYIDEPRSVEERLAESIIGHDIEGNLVLAFSGSSTLLQIHGCSGLFLHAESDAELAAAVACLPRDLDLALEH